MTNAPSPAPVPTPVTTVYLYGLLGLAILNGIFSPFRSMVFVFHTIWYPAILPASLAIVLFLSSLITATLTLMVAGVPAALYERFFGSGRTDQVSLWIWIATLAIISVPAVTVAIGQLR
jgi:hypothetical protein